MADQKTDVEPRGQDEQPETLGQIVRRVPVAIFWSALGGLIAVLVASVCFWLADFVTAIAALLVLIAMLVFGLGLMLLVLAYPLIACIAAGFVLSDDRSLIPNKTGRGLAASFSAVTAVLLLWGLANLPPIRPVWTEYLAEKGKMPQRIEEVRPSATSEFAKFLFVDHFVEANYFGLAVASVMAYKAARNNLGGK